MNEARTKVTCFIGFDTDYYHAARTISALHDLDKAGRISLKVRLPRRNELELVSDPLALTFKVERGTGAQLVIADLRDQRDCFSEDLLASCDVYFKRSYYAPALSKLGSMARKIRPLGFNYGCRTSGFFRRICRALSPAFIRCPAKLLRTIHHQARRMLSVPCHEIFERLPGDTTEETVVFQTRVWGDRDTGTEPAEKINQERVHLIRALRDAFGPRFIGGLVPTALALKRYPELVVSGGYRKKEYIRMAARSRIGVYSRGLHYSTAWKLPEYLAASQCIVAEPPQNTLPVPFVSGQDYLQFLSPNECVSVCEALLSDAVACQRMREASHRYYRDEVSLMSWMGKRLSEIP